MKILIFLLLPCFASAQSFFVSYSDTYSAREVREAVKAQGYAVTTDSAHADYVVNLVVSGAYRLMSFKRSYQGYIYITDRSTGKEIARTPVAKANPDQYDGFNAAYRIFGRIDRRYLATELKKIPKKPVANQG